MTDQVLVTDEGAVRTIRMNRPDKKNALTAVMYDAMADAIETAGGSSGIGSILIAGVPGAFCAGNDLQDFLKAAMGGEGLGGAVIRFLYALARAERPLVAAVQRSEEHTSELQSRFDLVCRLLLEKKKQSSSSFVRVII